MSFCNSYLHSVCILDEPPLTGSFSMMRPLSSKILPDGYVSLSSLIRSFFFFFEVVLHWGDLFPEALLLLLLLSPSLVLVILNHLFGFGLLLQQFFSSDDGILTFHWRRLPQALLPLLSRSLSCHSQPVLSSPWLISPFQQFVVSCRRNLQCP